MAYTLDQHNDTVAANAYLRYNTTSAYERTQQFIPSVTQPIGKVTMGLYLRGNPSGNVWMEIYTDNGSNLADTQTGSDSSTYPCSSITKTTLEDPQSVDFTWPSGGPILTANTKYWMVLRGDYAVSTTDCLNVCVDASGSYASGLPGYVYQDGTFYSDTGYDFIFQEYYYTEDTTTSTSSSTSTTSTSTTSTSSSTTTTSTSSSSSTSTTSSSSSTSTTSTSLSTSTTSTSSSTSTTSTSSSTSLTTTTSSSTTSTSTSTTSSSSSSSSSSSTIMYQPEIDITNDAQTKGGNISYI